MSQKGWLARDLPREQLEAGEARLACVHADEAALLTSGFEESPRRSHDPYLQSSHPSILGNLLIGFKPGGRLSSSPAELLQVTRPHLFQHFILATSRHQIVPQSFNPGLSS